MNQPFDLTKLQYAKNQAQLRKTFLKRSVIPTVIILLVALWFLLPTTLTHFAIGKYKGKSYSSARVTITPLTWTSPERFVVEFNSGTIDTRLGKYDRAESELTRALAIAPADKKCMTAQNLVASHQARVKTLEKNSSQANIYKNKAKDVIAQNKKCFVGASASGGGASSSSAASSSDTPTDAQQDQLQQKEQEGRDRQEQFARDEKYDPSKPITKPW